MDQGIGMVVFIAAGGTGGHIFPGIALYERFRDQGDFPVFIGAARDRRFPVVQKLGQRHVGLPVRPLYRRRLHLNLFTLTGLIRSVRRSLGLIRTLQPKVCVGMGGFASAPMLLACLIRKVPVVLCEQNGYPGLVTRLFSRFARGIILNFPEASKHLPAKTAARQVVLGNPVRPGFDAIDRKAAREWFGLSDRGPVLAVTGGSQGADAVNRAVAAALPALPRTTVLWSAGAANYESVCHAVSGANIHVFPFVDRMDLFLGAADLVVSRAGATSLAEIAAAGVPALLVPYPFAAADHQRANAAAFCAAGAAVSVEEGDGFDAALKTQLLELLGDPASLERMRRNVRKLHDSATPQKMVSAVLQFAGLEEEKQAGKTGRNRQGR